MFEELLQIWQVHCLLHSHACGNCMDIERLSHVVGLLTSSSFLWGWGRGFSNWFAHFASRELVKALLPRDAVRERESGRGGKREQCARFWSQRAFTQKQQQEHTHTHASSNALLLYFIFLFNVWFRTSTKCSLCMSVYVRCDCVCCVYVRMLYSATSPVQLYTIMLYYQSRVWCSVQTLELLILNQEIIFVTHTYTSTHT